VLHELWCGAPAAQDAASGHASTGRGSGKCSEPCMPARRGDDDDDNDEGRINFSVALCPKTTRTRNNKLKQ